MSTAQIAVAAYGSAWAAWSLWRGWPQTCRKIATDIWQGFTSFFQRAAIFDSGPSCSCGSTWHRSEYRHTRPGAFETAAAELQGHADAAVRSAQQARRRFEVTRTIVPQSEHAAGDYEYRTVADSRLTDDQGNYRTVTQRRLRDEPGAQWQDTGFGYCKPPRDDDPGLHELCR